MSAVLELRAPSSAPAYAAASAPHAVAPAMQPRIALLGTGTVGSAVVARVTALRERGIAVPPIAWLCNSRAVRECGDDAAAALLSARAAPALPSGALRNSREARGDASNRGALQDGLRAGDLLVDATASDAIAAGHADWLSRGVHVVTANKLGCGSASARADAIESAQRFANVQYGDAATVGAGLPLLRTLRELVAGGDRIHAIEGVLSGSLAWLFARFDDTRPFSDLVRQARDAGYTEPDPRADLSGEDVRRKLLILARAAGIAIKEETIDVQSLVPAGPSSEGAAPTTAGADHDRDLAALDAPLSGRFRQAQRDGGSLHFVGRVDAHGARVGLQALPPSHALCGGSGTDNRVAIFSDRYRTQPLVIQGPGAGADVTAAALIDDVLRIARMSR